MGEQRGQTGFEAWQQIAAICWFKKKPNKFQRDIIWLFPLFPALISIHIYIKNLSTFPELWE